MDAARSEYPWPHRCCRATRTVAPRCLAEPEDGTEAGVHSSSPSRRHAEDDIDCRFVEASGATTVADVIELVYEAVHGRRRDSTDRLLASRDGRAELSTTCTS